MLPCVMLPRHAKGTYKKNQFTKASVELILSLSICTQMVYLEEESEGIHDAFGHVVVQWCSEISLEATRHVGLQLAEGGGLQRLEVDLE